MAAGLHCRRRHPCQVFYLFSIPILDLEPAGPGRRASLRARLTRGILAMLPWSSRPHDSWSVHLPVLGEFGHRHYFDS